MSFYTEKEAGCYLNVRTLTSVSGPAAVGTPCPTSLLPLLLPLLGTLVSPLSLRLPLLLPLLGPSLALLSPSLALLRLGPIALRPLLLVGKALLREEHLHSPGAASLAGVEAAVGCTEGDEAHCNSGAGKG